jgi:hypothetical protein
MQRSVMSTSACFEAVVAQILYLVVPALRDTR